MQRFSATRVVALLLLLLHGSAFGAAAVLDALIATRANAAVAHVESDVGATCVAHDEATCQVCRVASTTLCGGTQPLSVTLLVRAERPSAQARAHRISCARSALHSRAPPVA